MTRDALVVQVREALSAADSTHPNTQLLKDALMELLYMETELILAKDRAQYAEGKLVRFMQAVREEVPTKELPYRVYAFYDDFDELKARVNS